MVSGIELAVWRKQALAEAIAAEISPGEVDWLLRSLSHLEPLSLRLELFQTQSDIILFRPWQEIQQLWKRRVVERVPLQYLVGELTWRNLTLHVAPGVLIPRPETELLIDLVLNSGVADGKGNWADLGTGSGAIALGLAEVLPNATIHAVDCSADALEIAASNGKRYAFGDRIHFYQGSWFEPLQHLRGRLAGVVSNPPYIPTSLIPQLQPEVRDREPHLALDGGYDGFDCIRTLIDTAPEYLQPGGLWAIEMMAGQADCVQTWLAESGNYTNIQIHRDLAGIERFAIAVLPKVDAFI
ncbi:peptide chain release factor N(5)-glutamine methyltransferase [Roseofilum casamattae]|uniref:Release factor glutamine methyltransferase n=1 Tax=Roseofilum casamattae BLCC-M143 TaxID=3022442 RepID=A0ABT7BT11_9CYAN|nr:peptide chain release factor N(5)-glutamine methyltransferase [Roseofilum casamattae]MDJ1182327.1 peptide chain release factor N(5)-glutamine methyltransferase [Roseofilum casamattae BLCC-M143]